jgi:hypothetical protein
VGRHSFIWEDIFSLTCFTVRYLPDWAPGTGFKETARHWKRIVLDTVEKPYAFVKQQMAHGKYEPSYTSKLIEEGNLSAEDEFVVKWSAFSLYTGGADTVRPIDLPFARKIENSNRCRPCLPLVPSFLL